MSSSHAIDVLRAFTAQPACALVVVTHVSGGAMRAPGAMMCVPAVGDVVGYVSNGCVDADIIVRARQAIRMGRGTALRYGEGSPFRDIVLPCGGQINVAILPNPDPSHVSALLAKLSARQSAQLCVSSDFTCVGDSADLVYETTLQPSLRLRIAGRGEAMEALAKLARTSGFDVHLQSPEAAEDVEHLRHPAQIPDSQDDARTAVVTLFHDHDWEPDILTQALNGPSFYVGAMGSLRTHAIRRDRLIAIGLSLELIEKIHAPIGLIAGLRDAEALAISILAEILQVAQTKGLL